MKYWGQSDTAILAELGRRLARHRLNRNVTQEALAHEAGLSGRTLGRIEQGESTTITNLVRLLRALDLLDGLDHLVPEPPPSPMQQLRLQGEERRRASSTSPADDDEPTEPWSWGNDS